MRLLGDPKEARMADGDVLERMRTVEISIA